VFPHTYVVPSDNWPLLPVFNIHSHTLSVYSLKFWMSCQRHLQFSDVDAFPEILIMPRLPMHCDGVIFSHISKIRQNWQLQQSSARITNIDFRHKIRTCGKKKQRASGQRGPDFGNRDHHPLPSTTPPTSIQTHRHWGGMGKGYNGYNRSKNLHRGIR
jgi:hypothetical protein